MGKIHDRHKRYRERLLRIIVFLLQNPGSHSIQEMVKRFNVSDKTLRGDFRYLEEIFNANGRQYIIRKHGRIEANFSRAVANLNPEVRLYFFLALKQVEPILRGEGERAYKELLQHAYAVLPKEDVERLKDWDKFYFISQYGYPLHRSHFYKTLTEVLDAIRFHQILKFTHNRTLKYIDPYAVYYAKHAFYIIGEYMQSPTEYRASKRGANSLKLMRLDRMSDITRLIHHRSKVDRDYKIIRDFKNAQVKAYIDQMLEAEHFGNRTDYVIHILSKEAYQRIVEKNWHEKQRVELSEKKGVVGIIEIPGIVSWQEIKKWILGWGSQVQLVYPADKRREIEEEIAVMFQMYGMNRVFR